MKTYHLKLVNGDEVISNVKEISKTKFELYNPMILSNVYDNQSGTTAVVLTSYNPFSEFSTPVEIRLSQITSKFEVNKTMKDYYNICVEYNVLYAVRDMDRKIGFATDSMKKFMQSRIKDSLSLNVSGPENLSALDDDLLEEITNSNTVFH